MNGEMHRLANGLTVAVDPMPDAQSVAIGLYAQVGSRSEPEQLSGLAHLVEHMVFKGAGSRDTRALAEAEFTGGVRNDRREFEQAHWCLGLPGLAASDARLPALSIFVQALGGGMSSRLFQELREERGLAYSVSAWQQAYGDAGIVGLSCAADRTRAVESMHLAREVLADAVDNLTDAEVSRARAQLEAGLLMALETPQGRAEHMARSIEVFGRILGVGELLEQLRSVDSTMAKAAGAAAIDGRAAISSVGAQLALAA